MEVLVLMVPLPPCGTPLWGSFACLNFGPCYLIFFLSLSWVLSFYKVFSFYDKVSSSSWFKGSMAM